MDQRIRCSAEMEEYRELPKIISEVNEVMENTALLDNIRSEKELEEVMPVLLASLGKYARADRSYIFELKPESADILHMTHVWCAEGIRPTIREKQDISLQSVPNWYEAMNKDGSIIIADWENGKDQWPEEYALFSGQGLKSIILLPLITAGTITGYIGIDNPKRDRKPYERNQRTYRWLERKSAHGKKTGRKPAFPSEKP